MRIRTGEKPLGQGVGMLTGLQHLATNRAAGDQNGLRPYLRRKQAHLARSISHESAAYAYRSDGVSGGLVVSFLADCG